MSGLLVVTFGECRREFVEEARGCIAEELGLSVSLLDTRFDTGFAFDARRGQYNSGLLLKKLVEWRPSGVGRVLGLIEADLFIPMLSFVYGQAQVGGPCALVAAARLRQEFYRMPADAGVFRRRVRKEVLHEVGHTLTLVHCEEPACVMSLATGLQQVDRKSETYCSSCRLVALEHIAEGREERNETPLENSDRR